MKKAAFLDRDGTINIDKGYVYRIEDFEFLPGAIEGMRLLQEAGYLLVIVTNQSGIARGYYQESDLLRLNQWLTDRLAQEGVTISGIYYCPHHPEAAVKEYRMKCACRKPGAALFYQATQALDIDLSQSVLIGDRQRDIAAAAEMPGSRGILVGSEFTLLDAARALCASPE